VGIVISKPRKDSAARQALPLLTIISHASMRPRTRLAVVEKVGGEGGGGEPMHRRFVRNSNVRLAP
jgi:hypothetical protein